METSGITRVTQFLTSTDFLLWVVWSGLALLTIGLLILMRTRWGRSRPLRKCVVLSLLAHLLLVGYAATVKIVTAGRGRSEDTKVLIADDRPLEEQQDPENRKLQEWERPAPPLSPSAPIEPLDRAVVDDVDSLPPALAEGVIGESRPLEAAPNLATSAPATAVPSEIPTADVPAEASATNASTAANLAAPQATLREAPQTPRPAAQELAKPQVAPATDVAATAPPEGPPRSRLPSEPNALPELAPAPATSSPDSLADVDPALAQPTAEPLAAEALMGTLGSVVRILTPDQRSLIQRGTAAQGVTPPSRAALPKADPLATTVGPPPPPELQPRQIANHHVPEMYRLRVQPNREQLVARRGGNAATQTAVRQALQWLASHQSPDGRWDASSHGSGQERQIAGHNREGAGAEADTGITGLALLAFLGDGHTQLEGPYRHVVQGGLDFLMRSQKADGSLSGNAEMYAAMYCHGMAAFALAEAYGMTGDPKLERAVKRAVAYTLSAQHPTQGGWRYRPGDAFGDTSQLGWQRMALKSAQFAGIEVPQAAREGMIRFLKSVTHGKHGGLASYRVGERSDRVMTAESLFCRQLLGMTRGNPASDEAGDYILEELPTADGQMNLYYWYYATLATYQLQGKYWETWNQALQQVLLERQVGSGDHQGSWDPDCIWGGYGGRVYSTAVSALCLEVYYRFLPLYVQQGAPLRR